MSQISPPIRVLLVAVVALLAAWMLFLRPSDDVATDPAATSEVVTPPAATTPGGAAPQSAAGDAVRRATEGAAATDSRAAELTGETAPAAGTDSAAGTTANAPATPAKGAVDAPPVDRRALATLPKDVAHAIEQRKVTVLLFWNPKSSDDRAVRRDLANVDRWNGRVFVDTAPIRRISRYAAITRGVNVEQSPTVVVVDRALKAEALVGYVDSETVDQAVVDAMRNSDVLIRSPYLRQVNRACRRTSDLFIADPNARDARSLARSLRRADRAFAAFARRLGRIEAPRRWRGFERASLADIGTARGVLASWRTPAARADDAALAAAVQSGLPRYNRAVQRFDARMDRRNVLSCGSNA